jgi:hypothetical protein
VGCTPTPGAAKEGLCWILSQLSRCEFSPFRTGLCDWYLALSGIVSDLIRSYATWRFDSFLYSNLICQMPEEFNYDGDIMELKEEIKGLQHNFIDVHKANEGVKAANR